MGEAFREGGWGMYPTTLFGLLLIGVAIGYAFDPARRRVPLIVSLGVMTLLSGGLGFITGIIRALHVSATGKFPEPPHVLAMIGLGESLQNVALALALAAIATLLACVGTMRIALGGA
jgi:hypothetical protein